MDDNTAPFQGDSVLDVVDSMFRFANRHWMHDEGQNTREFANRVKTAYLKEKEYLDACLASLKQELAEAKGEKSTMDVHFKLEEVINQIDKLPEFAKEPVLRAYKALKELHGYYLSMPQIGYADQTHAINANTVREALGEPQRIVILIKEHDLPIRWCSFNAFPGYPSVVDGMKALQKTEAGRCRNLKEFLHEMPKVLVLNNGKTFNLFTMEMTRMNEYRYEYKEVIT